MQEALGLIRHLRLLVVVAVVAVLQPVEAVPAREEVVLDPDYFAQGLDEGDFPAEVETRVGEDGLEERVLDVGQAGAEEDVVDVEGVAAAFAYVHQAVFGTTPCG